MSSPTQFESTDMAVTMRVVDTYEGLLDLEKPWNALYQQCTRSTIFSSWDWTVSWWEVYKDQFKRSLRILCLYKGDELLGIAPFQIEKNLAKFFIQGKTLRFIGTGEARQDTVVSQYLDFIVAPGYEEEMIQQVSNYLIQHKKEWNFADFEYLLPDALISKCFTDSKSVSRKQIEYGVRFFIPELESPDEYFSNMNKRWRKMFNKKMRLLSRDGEVDVKTTRKDEPPAPFLSTLVKMHQSRWKDRTGHSIFDSERFSRFHEIILSRLVKQDKAAIRTITLNNKALASYYIFTDKGKIHYYQSGFFSEYANRYSPLFLLVCNEIGMAITDKKHFDFMYTDSADSYKKSQYAADYEQMYRLRWTTQPIRFYVFACAKDLQTKLLKFIRFINNKRTLNKR